MKLAVILDGQEVGFVIRSDAFIDDAVKQRADNAFTGMVALEGCLKRYHPDGMPVQERLLRVVRGIAEALNDGERDQYMEQDIMREYVKLGSLSAVASLIERER